MCIIGGLQVLFSNFVLAVCFILGLVVVFLVFYFLELCRKKRLGRNISRISIAWSAFLMVLFGFLCWILVYWSVYFLMHDGNNGEIEKIIISSIIAICFSVLILVLLYRNLLFYLYLIIQK